MNIRKSLLIIFSSGYARSILQFLTSIIIARLLTPEEFGIFSVAMVIVIVADTMRNFGVAGYIVQEKNLTKKLLDSASGLNYLTSWISAAAVGLLASPASRFYGNEGVGEAMRVLAVSFLLLPVGAATMAYMKRELLFHRIAAIQVGRSVAASASGILLAYQGYGYMSLAWSQLIATCAGISLVWLFKPAELTIRPSLRSVRPILRFGALSTINSVTKEAGRRFPDLIIGKLISVEGVGFFARADGLIDFFRRFIVASLSSVIFPHLATEVRRNANPVPMYLLAVSHLTAIGWPFLIVVAISAPNLVPLLYGDQWHAAIPLAQLLCIGELFLLPFYLQDQVLVAKGRIGIVTKVSLLGAGLRLTALFAFTTQGLQVAVAGYAASSLLVACVFYFVALKFVGTTIANFWTSIMPSFGVAVMTLVAASGMKFAIAHVPMADAIWVLSIFFAASAGWFIGLILTKHPMLRELSKLINYVLSKR